MSSLPHSNAAHPELPGNDLLCLLPNGFTDLIVQVTHSGKITQADRYDLMAVLMNPDATSEEFFWIDRLYWRLKQGYLEIVDDLSSISP